MNATIPSEPDDEFNRHLREQTAPPHARIPAPATRYHLVVIGAGTAGLVSAAAAASLGARVALIEKHRLGGDCLHYGCVPSKALLGAARQVARLRKSAEFGIHLPGNSEICFPEVMQRMRRLRAAISHHDSVQRFTQMGVDVFPGTARFADRHSVEVGGQRLRFRKAIIATGTRAAIPPVPGLAEAGYLTNETVFSLTELPRRLAVVGGGPIGCELAQAFARFGADLTLIESSSSILSREEPEAAALVVRSLQADGVRILTDARIQQVAPEAEGLRLEMQWGEARERVDVDRILIAAGRTPNIEELELAKAGIQADPIRGVVVNDRLQTTNRHVYAAGDIASDHRFTHAADFLARTAVRNSLFPGGWRASRLVIPWCTYTDPEIAHVGLYESEARGQYADIDIFTQPFSGVDRALLDGDDEGYVRILCRKRTGKIVGATVAGSGAGDLISVVALAMQLRIPLGKLASVVHPYPTRGEVIRKLADQFQRTRLTPFAKRVLAWWLSS